MFQYVAVTWSPSQQQQAATAERFSTRVRLSSSEEMTLVYRAPGLMVFCAGVRPGSSEPLLLADQGGVVLGKLFGQVHDAQEMPTQARLGRSATSAILNSGGRHLFEHYWGRYVAFVRDEASRTTRVLRDPSGGMPCYVTRHDGLDIFFSSIEGFLALEWLRFSINWEYVAALAAFYTLQVRETGLNEVEELQPGECAELRDDCPRREVLYWDPVRIAQNGIVENADAAALELQRTTRQCISAWAACYPRILHRLSGGLDSAIVLDGLVRAPVRPQITCVNHFYPSHPSDERTYARQAANQAGCELVEWELDVPATRIEAMLEASRSARPHPDFFYCTHSRFEARLAHEKGAAATFTGEGGDANFYSGMPLLPPADYVHRHGLGAGLWGIALDAAPAARVSVWHVLWSAIREGLVHRRHAACDVLAEALFQPGSPEFATPDIMGIRSNAKFTSPRLAQTRDLARGKLWHLLSMSLPPPFYNPLGQSDAPEMTQPLLSQPVVELCLRIPTWVLAAGGRDRALARRAFSDSVPSSIIARRDKGNIDRFLLQLLRHNQAFVRGLLCEGQLAKAGIIDRRRIEQFFSDTGSHAMPGTTSIAYYMNLEAWLGSWTHGQQRMRGTG